MPTFHHGKKTEVVVNKSNLTGYFKEYSVGAQMDTAEVSAFGADTKSFVQGISSSTLSLSGMFSGDVKGADEVLSAAVGAASETIVSVATTGKWTPGSPVMAGKAWESSYQASGSIGDIVACSAEFQGTGDGSFRSGVSLYDLKAAGISVTTTGSTVDQAVATSDGALAVLHLFPNTFNHTATIKIEHSDGAGATPVWASLATFDVVAASTESTQTLNVPAGTTINKWVRVVATLATSATAASGSLQFTVSFARL